ncbi:hypothetical protein CYMTET_18537 [Cymbomonas tetramitiformis]|uniref:Secreted protein n=1 Tax=Cymbomonas tetramitiformis TaxID=36881 RepID=A0AAE0L633_9CHLO|nr:hypothetical protein CYMTET_18537 [Cymbomonas tetramitiformis]
MIPTVATTCGAATVILTHQLLVVSLHVDQAAAQEDSSPSMRAEAEGEAVAGGGGCGGGGGGGAVVEERGGERGEVEEVGVVEASGGE